MASEDSALNLLQSVLPVSSVRIHREGNSRQCRKSLSDSVLAPLHSEDDLTEPGEFRSFVRPERILLEVRKDSGTQLLKSMNRKCDNVAVWTLRYERPASKKPLQLFQNPDPISVLVSLEYRCHQPSRRPLHVRMRSNADAEAAFCIHETSHIPGVERPFLLIVCTQHVFTAFPRSAVRRVAWDSQTSQHIARFYNGL